MKNQTYFEGLNSLRFFAALLVLLNHCQDNLIQNGINYYSNAPILWKGSLAVEFFFVLSGFLLTFLALNEIQLTNKIDLNKFFLRRILRIFPLYYFAVFLGYLLLGIVYPLLKGEKYLSFSISEGLPFHLFFLPNYLIAKWQTGVGSLYGLWSIGVEEQFYLFFPFLMLFIFSKKYPIRWIFLLSFFYFLFYFSVSKDWWILNDIWKRFLLTLKFHFMFIGSLFALGIYYFPSKVSKLIQNRIFQIMIWLILSLSLFLPFKFDSFHLIQAIVFGFLILIVSNKEKRIINIEIEPLSYFGKISYGIYIYHGLISYPLRFALEESKSIYNFVQSFPPIYYISELLLTLIVAHLSYQYFEMYFLKFKEKFKVFSTHNN